MQPVDGTPRRVFRHALDVLEDYYRELLKFGLPLSFEMPAPVRNMMIKVVVFDIQGDRIGARMLRAQKLWMPYIQCNVGALNERSICKQRGTFALHRGSRTYHARFLSEMLRQKVEDFGEGSAPEHFG